MAHYPEVENRYCGQITECIWHTTLALRTVTIARWVSCWLYVAHYPGVGNRYCSQMVGCLAGWVVLVLAGLWCEEIEVSWTACAVQEPLSDCYASRFAQRERPTKESMRMKKGNKKKRMWRRFSRRKLIRRTEKEYRQPQWRAKGELREKTD